MAAEVLRNVLLWHDRGGKGAHLAEQEAHFAEQEAHLGAYSTGEGTLFGGKGAHLAEQEAHFAGQEAHLGAYSTGEGTLFAGAKAGDGAMLGEHQGEPVVFFRGPHAAGFVISPYRASLIPLLSLSLLSLPSIVTTSAENGMIMAVYWYSKKKWFLSANFGYHSFPLPPHAFAINQ